MNLFEFTKYGLILNKEIKKMILSVPIDNIVNQEGNKLTICGFGAIFIVKGKQTICKEFLLSTIFDTIVADINPASIVDENHIDLVYDNTSYIVYVESGMDPSKKTVPIARDISNVEFLFNKLIGGKFSNKVQYENQIKILLNNLELNKHLNIPLLYYELLIASGFINSKSSKEYRLDEDPKYLETISLLEQAMSKDTFSGLTHQDAKTAMLVAMSGKQDKKNILEEFAFL